MESTETINYFATNVSIIKELFHILFFIIVGSVTVLTYLKANKTILQPMKNEIFKKQLSEFTTIMDIFNEKSEIELREYFGLSDLIKANAFLMLDNYASLFFDMKIAREKRPYNINDCPSSLVTQDFIEKNFTLVDEHIIDETSEIRREPPDPMVKATLWKDYNHGDIKIPRKTSNSLKELDKILKSPLLPKECIKYLVEIKNTVNNNIMLVKDVLEEIAQELPEKYSNRDALKKANITWITNRYNHEFNDLEETADKLTDYLREYLNADSLLDK